MPKIHLICGKICSGKTHYTRGLIAERGAVLLSSDELISALFHPNENDFHDKIIKKVHAYLFDKAAACARSGASVVLDWGFWSKTDRAAASAFFRKRGIAFEWHYIDVSDANWRRNIERRNAAVERGETTDYFVDEGLLAKLESLFEVPERSEIDVWVDA